MSNVVLIGMPGCGKSTLGVLLAKAMGMAFVDTDLVLQLRYGEKLQTLLCEKGVDAFLKLEEETVCALQVENAVIATGGSVIYGTRAVERLKAEGCLVYLKTSLAVIENRVRNLSTRGVALRQGQTLEDLYRERTPLYERACDLCFEERGERMENDAEALRTLLEDKGFQPQANWREGKRR